MFKAEDTKRIVRELQTSCEKCEQITRAAKAPSILTFPLIKLSKFPTFYASGCSLSVLNSWKQKAVSPIWKIAKTQTDSF